MVELLLVFIILLISVGSLLFLIGFGTLFISAFAMDKRISVILLILLGFSPVLFVAFSKPWYYALPLFLLPALLVQFFKHRQANMKRAIIWFWLGLFCFGVGAGILTYTTFENVDMPKTMDKFKK